VSSPITFSGFNNIDFSSIVDALMQQASEPLTTLQANQTAVKSQISAFGQLAGRISTLQSAAAGLSNLSSISMFAGTSSDPASVAISAADGAQEGHYEVEVLQLARAQVTVSTSSAPDSGTTIVASSGTLSIGGVDVTLTGDVTLEGLAAAINGTDGIGVTATVIRTAPDTYRLALTSRETGEANAFTVSSGLAGVTFAGNAVEASDAELEINGIPVTSSSNVLDNVMPGVTIVAFKTASEPVRLDVAPDSDALKTRVQSFITAYNAMVTFMNDQRTAAGNGDAKSIGRDPLLRQLHTDLRTTLMGTHGSELLTNLAEVGVEFTREGTLELNDTLFDAAVAGHAVDLQNLFAGAGGAFTAVDTLLDNYSQANGFVANVRERLNAQVDRMDDQIAAMQDRLAVQRLAMQQEFAAADAAISALNAQRDNLANFMNTLGSNL
jgi:flagellar hook-associated protein 2